MTNISKTDRQDQIRKVAAGMSKYYGNLPQVRLAGTVYPLAALQQFLVADIAASDAADQAKAAWLKMVEAQRATRGKTNPVLRAIRNLVLADYGDSKDVSDVLAVFGYSPRKPRKASGAAMVAAADKAKATRKARGTKGSKQKREIKGATTSPPATPPVAKP